MKSNDKEAAFKKWKKKNIMEELRDKLLDWAKQFETPDFIKDDPIFFHISTMIKGHRNQCLSYFMDSFRESQTDNAASRNFG